MNGAVASALPSKLINSRRLIAVPEAQDWALYRVNLAHWTGPADVRFVPKADIDRLPVELAR
jgi:hypothetical protein